MIRKIGTIFSSIVICLATATLVMAMEYKGAPDLRLKVAAGELPVRKRALPGHPTILTKRSRNATPLVVPNPSNESGESLGYAAVALLGVERKYGIQYALGDLEADDTPKVVKKRSSRRGENQNDRSHSGGNPPPCSMH